MMNNKHEPQRAVRNVPKNCIMHRQPLNTGSAVGTVKKNIAAERLLNLKIKIQQEVKEVPDESQTEEILEPPRKKIRLNREQYAQRTSNDEIQPYTSSMDWSNNDKETSTSEGCEGDEDSKNSDVITTQEIPSCSTDPSPSPSPSPKSKDICVVVDTNVFIHEFDKIQEIINIEVQDRVKPVIFVSWMVLTELDFMKHNSNNTKLKKTVSAVVKFIEKCLRNKNPRIIGQTVFEVEKQLLLGPEPDDKILSCCLQAKENFETVILLTNDVNFKCKALVHNLLACSTNEINVKIMSYFIEIGNFKTILNKMGFLCTTIVCECAKKTFGSAWSKMDLLKNPPWSLKDCLKRFDKYWDTIFKERVMKQFKKALSDLDVILQNNNHITNDSNEFLDFKKSCINFCIFLKDVKECRPTVNKVLGEIIKIG